MYKNTIIGQAELKKRLRDSLREGRPLHHAFLLNGERGMGKKTFAYALAQAILCQNNKYLTHSEAELEDAGRLGNACNVCDACRFFCAGTHPDFKHIERGREKTIKVEMLRREVIADIQLQPQISDYKVYLLNLDDLSEQSQNALLKSLEEPPAYVVFILMTTLLDNLLETILSRVNIFNFQKYNGQEMREILSQHQAAQDLDFIISYAQGNPGLALQLIEDENFQENRQKAIDIFFSLPTVSRAYLLTTVLQELLSLKDQIDLFLNIWQDLLHDLLILLTDQSIKKVNQMLIFDRIKKLADYYISETPYSAEINHESGGAGRSGVSTIKEKLRSEQITHSFEAISELRKANQVNVNTENALGQLLLTMRKDLHINGRSN